MEPNRELDAMAEAFEARQGRTHRTDKAWWNYAKALWREWWGPSALHAPRGGLLTGLLLLLETCDGFVRNVVLGRALLGGAGIAIFSVAVVQGWNYLGDQREQRLNTAWSVIARIAAAQLAQRPKEDQDTNQQNDGTSSVRIPERAIPIGNVGAGQALQTLIRAGIDLSEIQLPRTYLSGADLRQGALFRANFSGSNLIGTRLNGARLEEARLRDSRLDFAVFDEADLRSADLSGARAPFRELHYQGSASFRLANLQGAKAVGALFEASNFESADFAGATFARATLRRANFGNAILCNVDFSGADVEGASFRQADIGNADFSGVRNLTQTQVSQACASKVGTPRNLPEGLTFRADIQRCKEGHRKWSGSDFEPFPPC